MSSPRSPLVESAPNQRNFVSSSTLILEASARERPQLRSMAELRGTCAPCTRAMSRYNVREALTRHVSK